MASNQSGALRTVEKILTRPTVGSFIVLLGFCIFFTLTTDTFLASRNLSVIVQQSVVIGTLAIGQTLVILVAGIDLANGAIAVFGTVVAGRLVDLGYNAAGALVFMLVVSSFVGACVGLLISRMKLPPFIVTLGFFGIMTAATRLLSGGGAFPVTDDLLTWSGNAFRIGPVPVTYGIIVMFALYALVWCMLTQTAWGRQIYAIGNSPNAARLVGIPVPTRLLSVYVFAALIYGIGAWLALGRIPNADPNAMQFANLNSITAVVIGGTSLFGGRGSLVGTLVGTLIVAVLRNGLTLLGIDPLWQDLVTGVLVIVAVALDQLARWRRQ